MSFGEWWDDNGYRAGYAEDRHELAQEVWESAEDGFKAQIATLTTANKALTERLDELNKAVVAIEILGNPSPNSLIFEVDAGTLNYAKAITQVPIGEIHREGEE